MIDQLEASLENQDHSNSEYSQNSVSSQAQSPISERPGQEDTESTVSDEQKDSLPVASENLSYKQTEELSRVCRVSQEMTDWYKRQIDLPYSCNSLVAMRAFNILTTNPSINREEIKTQLQKLQHVIQEENKASQEKALPSIGLEVEVPRKYFELDLSTDPISDLMFENGLATEEESTLNYPTEFIFPPSYNALTQSSLLLELRKAGFIPTNKDFASMHINFGVKILPGFPITDADDILNTIGTRDTIICLSDLLTYAFVPGGRIRSRGYNRSFDLESRLTDVELDRDAPAEKTVRLEFRTPRVVGPNTYRLLDELQELVTLVQNDDKRFVALRDDLLKVVDTLRDNYSLEPNGPESNQSHLADQVEEAYRLKQAGLPNLISDAQHIMWDYANQVRNLRAEKKLIVTNPRE